ncbi:hypothetical protein KMZ93_03805 [Bradyrhizobium sediminis]|uniref:Uncharacterized protein n=1 Tax=Bradyrhizobium sediminis TaxID=2840469 RepID=A0A975P1Y1_9BRAD|nr:hypothetical protein [Bradyrhizobium sediminis]QWG24064.1 hypothetical protein KMZ93_03805 [Bradyrhizobium sediminis]
MPGEDFNFSIGDGPCGLDSSILKTYKNVQASVTVKGQRFDFMPILITDKRRFNCYAVKLRAACIVTQPTANDDGGFTIELKAARRPTAVSTKVTVSRDGKIAYPESNTQFFLLRDGLGSNSLANHIDRRLGEEFQCSEPANCAYQRTYFIEWLLLNKFRVVRAPPPVRGADLADDRKYFFEKIGNSVSGIKRVVQTFIMENEIGTTSPYALGDAVLADSGPSFGSHQIDIATNSGGEVAAFREILNNAYGASRDARLIELLSRIRSKLYERPIREFKTGALRTFYSDWPLIDGALRSDSGKARYNSLYVDYLASVEREFERLKRDNSFVAIYPWAGFYLIDIKNQYGSNEGSRALFATAARQAANPIDFVNRVSKIVLSYQYSRRSHQAACDTKRRLKNVIRATNAHYGGSTPLPNDCND